MNVLRMATELRTSVTLVGRMRILVMKRVMLRQINVSLGLPRTIFVKITRQMTPARPEYLLTMRALQTALRLKVTSARVETPMRAWTRAQKTVMETIVLRARSAPKMIARLPTLMYAICSVMTFAQTAPMLTTGLVEMTGATRVRCLRLSEAQEVMSVSMAQTPRTYATVHQPFHKMVCMTPALVVGTT